MIDQPPILAEIENMAGCGNIPGIDYDIKHLVMFSGGVGSWAAAKRVVERHGTEGVVLLFADTLIEDEDLYRFIVEAAENVGAPLVRIADGRTPWQVFRDERYLGNARTDPCSKILKRKKLDDWRNRFCSVRKTTIHVGIDWSEMHRIERLQKIAAPWKYNAPMCEKPYVTKAGMLLQLFREGIKQPELYDLGFPHNNCGGGCVKAGIAQFTLLLRVKPDVYAEWEREEQAMIEFLERDDISILRDRRGGTTKPLTLRMLRERIESQDAQQYLTFDEQTDWGGCGCAIE